MVKIRLARMGNKHRPFYRIVVQKSTAGRNSAAIEFLGTYNPLTKPSTVTLKSERALHWLMEGAQPTETVAVILKREGVLASFFEQRPKAAARFKFLDKTTAAMSKESVVSAPAEAKVESKVESAPVVDDVVDEAPVAVVSGDSPVDSAPVDEVKSDEVSE